MKPNPKLAGETLVKIILFLNIVFLVCSFFFSIKVLVVLIINILLLLLRYGFLKHSEEIMYRGGN